MAESRARARRPRVEDPARERDDWLRVLNELVEKVQGWVRPEWSTRVIQKAVQDSDLGEYRAPALLIQREIARVLLEPITRFAPGTDGVADLYLMPAYDGIASLYRVAGEWRLHYAFRGENVVAGIRNAEALPLTAENFLRVLESIATHAASTFRLANPGRPRAGSIGGSGGDSGRARRPVGKRGHVAYNLR